MKMKCILCTLGALVMCTAPVFAQAANKQEKSEFNPHWFMQVQAGASYTLGEGPFGKLVSPAAALSAGYQFSPVWGLRFGLSGWQSKGAWVSPQTTYQYKYRAMSKPRSIWPTFSAASIPAGRSIPSCSPVSA